ncbi:hypothetical protein ACGF5H_23945 [Micromonospora chalcea]|uniref:Uncharacterized protein n=1 Tax=Micromonospora chalcea TaxID=1874 RepID=A0ABX9Y3L1_MICCH|nr:MULTISPECIES: hypothetical protein [Micromonospora]AXO34292.1 hypothetical protein MicB006_2005 [Micromonospora sp. B006]EWM67016.1 hypothetical protein MCBG_04149 [Micromonospora sp. M42]MBC8992673.1 hypothetical protein [Micromonospora chalcea]MBQ1062156.1 hypothetical protein [Micromonospora sp. C41]MCK1807081.1 hypothetical protein [Micromonospora sp. R42106]
MSYQLSAVVADVELLREQTADLDHAVLAALRQDFALLPVTPQLVQELTGGLPDFATDEPRAERPFRLVLSPPLAEVLARWSTSGPVAYLEAEFAGGLGHQSAVVWLGGEVSWGPRYDAALDRPRTEWPINTALARLGAEPGAWIDPFAELGLHLERDTDGWLTHGRRGLSADYWDELAEEWELRQSGQHQQPHRPGPVGDWGIA